MLHVSLKQYKICQNLYMQTKMGLQKENKIIDEYWKMVKQKEKKKEGEDKDMKNQTWKKGKKWNEGKNR